MNSLFLEDPAELADIIDNGPTLLAFTAGFCGPSRILQGLLDHFVDSMDLSMTLVEIDVEKHPSITRHYNVKGVPELIFVKNGEPASSRLGTMSYDQLVEYVEGEMQPA